MINGLYKADFQTPLGAGAGVVYANGGKMWGGDTGMAYVGSYEESGDKIMATVMTKRHTQFPGATSVFGTDNVTISLDGTVRGNVVTCTGSAPQAPGVSFRVVLTKISD